MITRTLTDLWPELGQDERLSIVLEQLSAEVKRLNEARPTGQHRAYLAGYANALADVMCFVVEGTPPPTLEECS